MKYFNWLIFTMSLTVPFGMALGQNSDCVIGSFTPSWEIENTFPLQFLRDNPLNLFLGNRNDALDYNGDGLPDLNSRNIRVEQELPSDSIFITSTKEDTGWAISTISITSDLEDWEVVGYFDFDQIVNEVNLKEIVIAERKNGLWINPAVLCSTGRLIKKFHDSVLLFVGDQDNDGRDELAIYSLPELKTILMNFKQ